MAKDVEVICNDPLVEVHRSIRPHEELWFIAWHDSDTLMYLWPDGKLREDLNAHNAYFSQVYTAKAAFCQRMRPSLGLPSDHKFCVNATEDGFYFGVIDNITEARYMRADGSFTRNCSDGGYCKTWDELVERVTLYKAQNGPPLTSAAVPASGCGCVPSFDELFLAYGED